MTSPFFKLNSSDFIKGLVVAIATPVVGVLLDALQLPGFDFLSYDWKALAMVGLTAGISYVLKNLFSDEEGKLLGRI